MEQVWSYVSFELAIGYLVAAFLVWYLLYGLELWLNGGSLGHGRFWVFEGFWKELGWFLPGGLAKRADYVREWVKPRPNVSGFIGEYRFEEIREKNLYEVVAREALGSGYYFWGVKVCLFFFLGPFTLMIMFVLVGLINLAAAIYDPHPE